MGQELRAKEVVEEYRMTVACLWPSKFSTLRILITQMVVDSYLGLEKILKIVQIKPARIIMLPLDHQTKSPILTIKEALT